ncbi:MAG: DUF1295 domain-containing protein [Tepidisphaera sp.]|nr:DUF1295 domain-containing protein [Tepidisphaera sp.]
MKSLENRIPPPILVVICGAGMWGLAQFGPSIPLGRPARLGIGVAVCVLGVLVLAAGFLAFRNARTTIDPVNIGRASSLVRTGIFRLTRNPMYVGFTVMLLGWAVVLGGIWTMLGPMLFAMFITRFQIVPEERVMLEKFGSEYAAYRASTRRWL